MNPGVSAATTVAFPHAVNERARSRSTASSVRSPGTISTSGITGAGLKKCMPSTRSGDGTDAPIDAIESDEVLVASTQSRATIGLERVEQRLLGVEPFDDRLDHQSRPLAKALSPLAGSTITRPPSARVGLRPGQASLLDLARERLPRSPRAPAPAASCLGIGEDDTVPGEARPARSRRPSRRHRPRRRRIAGSSIAVTLPVNAASASRGTRARLRGSPRCARPRAAALPRASSCRSRSFAADAFSAA